MTAYLNPYLGQHTVVTTLNIHYFTFDAKYLAFSVARSMSIMLCYFENKPFNLQLNLITELCVIFILEVNVNCEKNINLIRKGVYKELIWKM